MKVLILTDSRIIEHILPNNIDGSYWITDYENEEKNLICLESSEKGWYLKSNFETKIIEEGKELLEIKLENYHFYKIKNEEKEITLFAEPTIENNYEIYKLKNDKIIISNDSSAHIKSKLLNDIKIILSNNNQIILETKSKNIYVNKTIYTNELLHYGDVIFINGIKIILLKGFIMINNPNNLVIIDNNALIKGKYTPRNKIEIIENAEEVLYDKNDYFYRSPRFRSLIEKVDVVIDEPPLKNNEKELPAILAIGPMITMGLTSLVTATTTVTNVIVNNRTLLSAVPTIAIALASFGTMLIWPSITRKYQKNECLKEEVKRQKKYKEYLDGKRNEIDRIIKEQSNILKENYTNLEECQNIILNKKTNLWERSIEQDDFLTVRLGIGNMPLLADIKYPLEHFTLEEDNLKKMVQDLVDERKELENVPIVASLTEKFITSVICSGNSRKQFIEGLLLQMITFQSYDFLKIVILTNKDNEKNWEDIRNIPYCFNNDKNERYFSTNLDEAREISLNLEREYQTRKQSDKNYKEFKPYYLIITDVYDEIRDVDIIKDVLNQEKNNGFSLILLSNTISGLPSECRNFISIGTKTSGMFESEISRDKQKEFVADLYNGNIKKCYQMIENIPIELDTKDGDLPTVLSFLNLYGVGKIEQLNALARWQMNDVTQSLSAPIGVDKNDVQIKLDIHEKYHGPHGLIAGMTGSGKSEFIITYILSLACNYSPNDVSFILIDYKGGGLARVFENKGTNKKLPHIAGTITNLDINEIDRALASIESELKRRERIFNEAREKTGKSTIDIYTYQKLYKQGEVNEPVSHLLIISDEFAELKTDRPEFMEKLIQTARIGRSLGVHLILATQKPAGIVSDQIWSNSRFRICLKVQDKNDSSDMLKRPDAVNLKNPGRFYLQVGYNELFVLGQSAYTALPYVPTDKINNKENKTISFINNVGTIIENIETENNSILESKGEEVINIISYITKTASELGISARKLWLDKISEIIYLDDLTLKYNFQKKDYLINPLIGEYDDPTNQRYGPVYLDLVNKGNMVIYGSADSGKEMLLQTIILSIALNYSPDEVNIYVADYGSEALKKYVVLPQVGDTILLNEREKTTNLFKYLLDELNRRKKIMSEYNGSYEYFIKESSEKLETIVLIINQYEAFLENFEGENEKLYALTRECANYGIYVILTMTNIMALKVKIKQNFGNTIVLKLANKDDYSYVLDFNCKLRPVSAPGRGIVRIQNQNYEFQTARVYEDNELNEKVKELGNYLIEKYGNGASKIRTLPEYVSYRLLEPYINNLKSIPIGINKDNLKLRKYDFLTDVVNPIIVPYFDEARPFVNGISKIINSVINTEFYILDSVNCIENKDNYLYYYANNFDELFERFTKIVNSFKMKHDNGENLSRYKNYCILIVGLQKVIDDINNSDKIIEMVEECKTIGKISFLVVDSIDKLKNIIYNVKCNSIVQNNRFIWYGNGLNEQYVLRVPYNSRKVLPKSFGYVVERDRIEVVKLVEEKGESENE